MVRGYGNWCGPGWTAGKHMNAEDMTEEDREVPAIDGLDMACKRHDIGLHDRPWMADEINAKFVKEARQEGVLGTAFAAAVAVGGPTNAPLPDQLALGEVNQTKKMGAFGGTGETARKQREWIRKVQEKDKEDAARHQEERNRAARQEQVNLRREPPEEPQNIPLPPDDSDELMNASFDNPPQAMEVDQGGSGGPGAVVEAARATAGSNNPVSKETPISPAQPSYGLQETHTTILPVNFWFSVVGPTYDGDCKMRIRTNSIDDVVLTDLTAADVSAADYTWLAKTLYNVPYNNNDTRRKQTAALTEATFPRTLATTNTTEQCWWANYWRNLYEYYTVLGMEYEIVIQNVQTNSNNPAFLIAIDHDSYSDTQGSTGNITPDATLAEFLSYRHVKWHNLDAQVATKTNNGVQIITGTVRPGQTRRNISNDGDVKTWTACGTTVGSAIPNLKEIMNIRFFRHPLSAATLPGSTPVMGSQPGANVQVKLKYLVQFKDLRVSARYPTTGGTAITNTLPDAALDSIGA